MLHLSRVAFGCEGLRDLQAIVARRAEGGRVRLTTRYLPKRHDEVLDGGSLYWISKHRLIARATVLAFEATPEGKTDIVLDARVIPVAPWPRRAHQGWRYLDPKDAPPDMAGAGEGLDALPSELSDELAGLGLL